ncbi:MULTISPECIES: hypothetical protein [Candidatus Brocadia]|nr:MULTISPECIES: hypothetical protein [Brocadia]
MHTFTDLVLLIGTNPLPNYVVAGMGNSAVPISLEIPLGRPKNH